MKASASSRQKPLRAPSLCVLIATSALSLVLPGAVRAEVKSEKETPRPSAEEPASDNEERILVAPENRMGCVWEISDNDNTVYLAGSVHLLRESDYPVSPIYDEVYAVSDEIIMEIDMGEMMNPEGMLRMQQLGMYPDDDTLDNHLKPETLDRLRQYLDTHESGKMIAMALPRLKPGMIFMTISSLEAMRLKARPDLGLEMVYYQKAQKDVKAVSGLETVEFQMTRFDEMTDDEIEALIVKTLDEIDEMPGVIDRIIAGWHEGDIAKLDKLMNEDMEEDAKVRELLLTERNANWIAPIEEAINGSRTVMFLVGAAHLIGKDSVVDMLEKKGYEVKKITPRKPLEASPEIEGTTEEKPVTEKAA